MADLPPSADPVSLARAREIRFLIQGQPRSVGTSATRVEEVFRGLEVLLCARRWREEPSVDDLWKRIRSACDRLRYNEGLDR